MLQVAKRSVEALAVLALALFVTVLLSGAVAFGLHLGGLLYK